MENSPQCCGEVVSYETGDLEEGWAHLVIDILSMACEFKNALRRDAIVKNFLMDR